MAVSASITFEQSASSPGPGISMVGVGGAVVTLTNADDSGVATWNWELLDSPLNSALVPGILGTSASEAFTPDSPETPGCYRVRLTVTGTDGSSDCDIKNFAVETATGWILPPFKATSAELNFPGNTEGWESLLNQIFLDLSTSGTTDELVAISASDTTAGLLNLKLVAGSNMTSSILNPGGNEKIELSSGDENISVSAGDTTPGSLESKLVAGSNVVVTKLNPGGNEQLEIAASASVATVQNYNISMPLSGITDTTFNVVGELRITEFFRAVVTGLTSFTYSTVFNVSNQHVSIYVTSLTGTGTVTITGTSLSESTAVPVASDTEVIVIDATGRYQTHKKWWEVNSVSFGGGISAIAYNIEVVGYVDLLNKDYKITGYRLDAYTQSIYGKLGLEIYKVEDLGNKKWQLVQLESIGFQAYIAGNQIVDSIRTGASERTYYPTVFGIVGNDQTLTFKQADFDSYFTSGENVFYSSTSDSGFVVRFRGEDGYGGGQIADIDTVTLTIYYELI
jgi:hypothetical protein